MTIILESPSNRDNTIHLTDMVRQDCPEGADLEPPRQSVGPYFGTGGKPHDGGTVESRGAVKSAIVLPRSHPGSCMESVWAHLKSQYRAKGRHFAVKWSGWGEACAKETAKDGVDDDPPGRRPSLRRDVRPLHLSLASRRVCV